MLRGIPEILSSDLLKALADMGHGDLIAIVDDFYPAKTMTPKGIVVQAKGNTAGEILDAVMSLMPIDTDYCEKPILHIIPDADSGIIVNENPVWDEMAEIVKKYGYDESIIGTIERSEYYKKACNAFVTVSTSEMKLYGCFILQKGVLWTGK